MRCWYVIFAIFFICCNTSNDKNKIAVQKQKIPKYEKKQKMTKEDIHEVEEKLYEVAQKLHSILKIKAKVLSINHGSPIHILLLKNNNGLTEIILSILESKPGKLPIKTGKLLKRNLLSEVITIKKDKMELWYDKDGNIDFSGTDKIFRTFDKPPQADIVLVPLLNNRSISKKGMIDIIKKPSQVHIYITN